MYKKTLLIMVFSMFILSNQCMANLSSYINKPEPDYMWEKVSEKDVSGGKIYELHMISQKWEGIIWNHKIQVFYPDKIEHPGICTVFNTGGNGHSMVDLAGITLARSCGTPLAVLWNVPNQPLFDGKREDALVAYSFLKFFETGNEDWPLLFPMVKSVIKSMDSLEAFMTQEGLTPVKEFIVTGVSKRGWTSWLTGAAGDARVKAIVPMVIDTLNMKKQMERQVKIYGKASDKIHDYRDTGILDKLSTEEGGRLLSMVDPYSYREKLTLPKLIVNGTNDQYWTLDGLNLYWDDLPGPKWILYVPNSGHRLEDTGRVINTVTSFIYTISGGQKFPEPAWHFKDSLKGSDLSVSSDIKPVSVTVFKSFSMVKDFRNATWEAEPLRDREGIYDYHIEKPEKGYCAFFGEVNYDIKGRSFSLSTQIKVVSSGQ
ncbi:MAG: PhoPQ-activated protein PqaA family protein [Candidatus Eremiobacterota bacterium]